MSKTFALLIGVQDYALLDRSTHHPQGSRDLSGALNDLSSMAMLVRMMGVEASHVRILSTPRMGPNDFAAVAMGRDPIQNMNMADAAFGFADKQSIVDGLTWLADQLQAHRDAQAIVYFSGHTVVTQAGHPCLAAADTQRQHPQAGGEDVADPRAVQTYLERSDLLCALDEVLGTSDPALMTRLVTALCDKPAELRRRPRARVAECARDLGKPPTRKGLSRFTEALANVGDDVRGAAKRARISQTLTSSPSVSSLPSAPSALPVSPDFSSTSSQPPRVMRASSERVRVLDMDVSLRESAVLPSTLCCVVLGCCRRGERGSPRRHSKSMEPPSAQPLPSITHDYRIRSGRFAASKRTRTCRIHQHSGQHRPKRGGRPPQR